MDYAVDVTIAAQKTVLIEADSAAQAARKAYSRELVRKQFFEMGEFTVIVNANDARELGYENKS